MRISDWSSDVCSSDLVGRMADPPRDALVRHPGVLIMSIEVRSIQKRFGGFTALDNVSLKFPDGKLTALLGPSGCGKTTLLRIIAGLEHPDSGEILLNGESATERHVRERDRKSTRLNSSH